MSVSPQATITPPFTVTSSSFPGSSARRQGMNCAMASSVPCRMSERSGSAGQVGRARRQVAAPRQPEADTIFEPMQPGAVGTQPAGFIDGKSAVPQCIDDMIEALADDAAWRLQYDFETVCVIRGCDLMFQSDIDPRIGVYPFPHGIRQRCGIDSDLGRIECR